ncbi:hypothetical protein [Polaromonas sp. AER18D-145]|uniref:hypothetical protein n=1 Tax=Polaromonas sp. AER18D-145 TaxID=1977060 RepID=UPI000BBC714E|nr:hypothetical protein [Polaromonas sp. AER18D-145]
MNSFKRIATILALAATTLLSACSKTVQWEEEVPLNTGETIWVKRSVVYSLKGAGGNPFDIGYGQDKTEMLSFQWGGKKYVYEGEAALMLLAISPQKQPVLVAPAADRGWDWNHNYYCATPHYVQFVPDASGREWPWPPEIEPWVYGMSHNLMRQRRKPEEMKTRYTAQQRDEEDRILSIQTPSRVTIDAKHISKNCKKRG